MKVNDFKELKVDGVDGVLYGQKSFLTFGFEDFPRVLSLIGCIRKPSFLLVQIVTQNLLNGKLSYSHTVKNDSFDHKICSPFK